MKQSSEITKTFLFWLLVTDSNDNQLAQRAIADLMAAVFSAVCRNLALTNAQLGRMMGIYSGHVGHEGRISRTLLGLLEKEGVIEQNNSDKTWHPTDHAA